MAVTFRTLPPLPNILIDGGCCEVQTSIKEPYCGAWDSKCENSVPNVPFNISCNIGSPNGTDCSAFPGSTYVPAGPTKYVSTGECVISSAAPSSGCGCKGIPVIQSIDLCDLALGAIENLSPSSINMFSGGC